MNLIPQKSKVEDHKVLEKRAKEKADLIYAFMKTTWPTPNKSEMIEILFALVGIQNEINKMLSKEKGKIIT